ncbi:hypothetical protein [Sporosarcina sp. P17b]|uniref:hypothetical protein n=1 Tax=Sporosarcina sp. P17b TaxID=2048260 RepID=UPI000C16E487|nr:hypothetical protein [Sporosarcina sp. P17b]PIC73354.1 hypothetical protein CSV76_11090 [Sporosarcina sp. P17b]
MKDYFKVRGTQETVQEIEVNVDTVYIRRNIKWIETEEESFVGWEYDEDQYAMSEFGEYLAKAKRLNEQYLVDIDYRLTLLEMGSK